MKSRFSPSPTGLMHLGNARTALFAVLLARSQNGQFLLRIEDTDLARSDQKYTHQLMEDLRWLGLEWQEGPEVGGKEGPYWQSQRQTIYNDYYKKLMDVGLAYECFCSTEQLAISRKLQRASGKAPRYAGTCRHLNEAEREQKKAEGIKPTLRFHVKIGETIKFHDFVKGQQRFLSDDLGDFIIRKTDDTPSFMYCNAIDDALMGVTHVIRGEDHVTNTPRQLLILKALSLREPEYGHISLILGFDGTPLSKRHGSRSLKALRDEGYFPETVLNYLARLGHYYSNPEYMSAETLGEQFAIKNLSKSPARFDEVQLNYWQKEALLRINNDRLQEWIGAETTAMIPDDLMESFILTTRANILFPKEVHHWAAIFFGDAIQFDDDQKVILQEAGPVFFEKLIAAVEEVGVDFKAVSNALKTACGVKGKKLFQPIRIALTGELHGPEMNPIFNLLGKDRILKRLQEVQDVCR